MITKTEKQHIADSYLMIINEYFTKFIDSEMCNYESNETVSYDILNSNLLTGLIIINRVFEYTFIKTKSTNSAYYYSNEAFTYYLEYMDQIYKANLSQNINHSDAIFFVYKKTIFDLFDGDTKTENSLTSIELGGKSLVSNIVHSNKDNNHIFKHISNDEFSDVFLTITTIIDLLLVWKESFANKGHESFRPNFSLEEIQNPCYYNRVEFCQKFTEFFFKDIEKSEYIVKRLKIVNDSLDIPLLHWKELLEELITEIKRHKKRANKPPDSEFTFTFYSNKDLILEKLENKEYNYVVKMLV